MAFEKPDLQELVERARNNFRSELPGTDAFLWPNNINVSAKVMGGMSHMILLWLDYIAKQRWITEADGQFLDRHGRVYGMPRKAASYAEGFIDITGVEGTAIPAGLTLTSGAQNEYRTIEAGTISAGTATVKVRALLPGAAGNAVAGESWSLNAAFDNIDSSGLVSAAGIGLGADEEGDESYRERLLWRIQMPPHGGAAHDYVAWAREIGGVTRVFVDPLAAGAGTVTVYFLMDETYSDGIPQGADVTAVQDYINLVRPVTAVVTVAAPTAVDVNIQISSLAPDTTAIRDAIALELADTFKREARVSTVSEPFTLYRSKLIQAIADAAGEDVHVLDTPATDVLYTAGQLPVLGTITHV